MKFTSQKKVRLAPLQKKHKQQQQQIQERKAEAQQIKALKMKVLRNWSWAELKLMQWYNPRIVEESDWRRRELEMEESIFGLVGIRQFS